MGKKIEAAIAAAYKIANNDSIGYCNEWPYNTGQKGYDCGAFLSKAWQEAGVFPVGQYYEPVGSGGNYNLYNEALLTSHGMRKIRYTSMAALVRGDILCSGGHTVMYLGYGRIIHARNNFDGREGDSSGNEICETAFYENNWCYVFRYDEESEPVDYPLTVKGWQMAAQHDGLYTGGIDGSFGPLSLKAASYGVYKGSGRYNLTTFWQKWLKNKGYYSGTIDGDFGNMTKDATIKAQKDFGLDQDGSIGPASTKAFLGIDSETGKGETTSEPEKADTEESGEYLVKVTVPDLNIRTGPGTNYSRTGLYTGEGIFTICETSEGTGSTCGWGKLKSGAGWIALDYAEKV